MGERETMDGKNYCFHHAALFYSGEDGFLAGTLPFIADAVATAEPVLVAVGAEKIDLLKHALGSDARHVHFADMQELGSNPARIIPAWRLFLDEYGNKERPVRGIGEPIWAGRSDAEMAECQRHESLVNVAFDPGQAWRLLCPYDLDRLEENVIEAAQRSHPFLAHDGASRPSDVYARPPGPNGTFDAELFGPASDGELPAPASQPRELSFTREMLGSLRSFVSCEAAATSLEAPRADDLVLAVNELATNSVRHGGGRGTLRIWTEAETLICEVRDAGHITDPLAGRIAPTPEQCTGRGLWVVNHLCDLVQIRSSGAGSTVRVHMRLS